MKNGVSLLFIIGFLFLTVSAEAVAELNKGRILHYTFDTNDGGTVMDQSGQNHHAAVMGATYTQDGRFGSGYYFNGINNYISVGNLGYQPTGTISFWMKAETVENWRNPFTTDYAGWDDCIRFEESSTGQFMGGGHGLGRGGNFLNSAMAANRWYHVVYSWDQNFAYGYLDGELKFKNPNPDPNSQVHPDLPLTAGQYLAATLNFTNVAIGNGYSTDPERFWKGWIDEVRIYNRVLTPEEVIALTLGTDDSLVLYFPFDQAPQSTVVADQSGKGNNGAALGGVTLKSNSGKIGGAYEFDGVNDSIKIPASASLNVGKQATFALWYKAYDKRKNLSPSLQQNPMLEYSDGQRPGVHVWANTIGFQWNGKGTGANFVDITGNENHVASTNNLPFNEWHHLVVTYEGNSGVGRVYIDGALAATEILGSFMPQTSFDLYVGRRPWDTQIYNGLLDEIRIYNRVLSDYEVRALYNAGTTGNVYQNFEANNGTPAPPSNPSAGPEYGWGLNGATVALSTAQFHSGKRSWQITSTGNFGGTGIPAQIQTYNVNFEPQRHDRLTFWVKAVANDALDHDVRVRFFDKSNYRDQGNPFNGFEVFTTKKAKYNQWTELSILFTQLPADFDLAHVDKINFVHEAPGTYYLDDIRIEARDRIYQSFESWICPANNPDACGWVWDGTRSISTTIFKEGTQSWKFDAAQSFAGTGIKNQEKRCEPKGSCSFQSEWNVDLNPTQLVPTQFDQLTFWVYGLANNGMANNLQVQFFDHNFYTEAMTNARPVEERANIIWTKKAAHYGQWTQLSVPFNSLPTDFDLTDIDKLQFLTFWPGTFYLDDIRAAKGPKLLIDPSLASSGIIAWDAFVGAGRYTLQESTKGPDGPWTNRYSGPLTTFTTTRLTKSWFRVRWETLMGPLWNQVPFESDWSDAVVYQPKLALIKSASLLERGEVNWTFIPQVSVYEVQEALAKTGTWTTIYKGGFRISPLPATLGKWYRVRGIKQSATGATTESTAWSPALAYEPSSYITAVGRVLKTKKVNGTNITLKGVNLGNFSLLEPWMLLGDSNRNIYPDDWTIRDLLETRFGAQQAGDILELYRNTYLQESDFDILMNAGINFVRLPIHYRDLRELDENGQWEDLSFDFSAIDRIVNFCADRGIYVLLDLHGAPGGQSSDFHSGQVNGNKLFDPGNDIYRQRTVELWQALAAHYRNNPTVAGYDLINEPFGVLTQAYYPTPQAGYQALWNLYNRIFTAIRNPAGANDLNHLIVLEGVPTNKDWDTLPKPSTFGWTNVMYQFHFYCFPPACPEDSPQAPNVQFPAQKAFLDGKITDAAVKQPAYNVPVMIGEFSGFHNKAVWDYYLTKFKEKGWSWAMWSYKAHDYPTDWGMYNHEGYNHSLLDFSNDSIAELIRKIQAYDTLKNHSANTSLNNILQVYFK